MDTSGVACEAKRLHYTQYKGKFALRGLQGAFIKLDLQGAFIKLDLQGAFYLLDINYTTIGGKNL
jgi:hypothetical protein